MTEGDGTFVGKGNLRPEDAELRRLQKELEEVKEERDILKKALGVFSKGSWQNTCSLKCTGEFIGLRGCARYWKSPEVIIVPGGSENLASGATTAAMIAQVAASAQ